MRDLNDRIARLEMCSEQLRLHLRSVPRDSLEAEEVRSDLLSMLRELAMLKGERQRLAHSLRLEVVA
jgi:hypothetical protein